MPRVENIDDFLSALAMRYDAYTRNRVRDDKTGDESIIPVNENRQVHKELQQQIDEICAAYLCASDGEREHTREVILAHRALRGGLLRHITWVAENKPPDWVRRGLAAASIEDNREDFRDTFVALGQLYLAAVEEGQDVSNCFQQVALLSSAKPGPFLPHSMRDFLTHFEHSSFFKQSIQPRLPSKKGTD